MKVKFSKNFFDGLKLYHAGEWVDVPDKYRSILPKGTQFFEAEAEKKEAADNSEAKKEASRKPQGGEKDFTRR